MQATERRLLCMRDIEAMTGATRKTIRAWIKAGIFPAPLALGRSTRGRGKRWWSAAAVERVLAGRAAGRRQATGKV